ncbi:hypothetical protein TNCV_2986851 [Trichonephila clavipes]|nr:hypothetical protein TNCV_2986851 [Trichonephila clavipes]
MARKRAENREGSLGSPANRFWWRECEHTRLGEGNDRCCADRLQPRNSTSVAELANRWRDRGNEMSSWVHGNKFSRRCSADRDSDQKSTVRSVARENL